jgi:hypothetical protein
MAIILPQELQPSVRPCPKIRGHYYGPVGGRRLKSGLFNRFVIVGILEVFGHNHAVLQSVTQALAHDPSVNNSMAPRPKRRGFKLEKNSRKGCDSFEKKRLGHLISFLITGLIANFIRLLYLVFEIFFAYVVSCHSCVISITVTTIFTIIKSIIVSLLSTMNKIHH